MAGVYGTCGRWEFLIQAYCPAVAGGQRELQGLTGTHPTDTMGENTHHSRFSFNKYILHACCVPGAALRPERRDSRRTGS